MSSYDTWKTASPDDGQYDPSLDDDGTCWRCGGDGFIFECFDGFCLDADVGCDDCTRPCPICSRRSEGET